METDGNSDSEVSDSDILKIVMIQTASQKKSQKVNQGKKSQMANQKKSRTVNREEEPEVNRRKR